MNTTIRRRAYQLSAALYSAAFGLPLAWFGNILVSYFAKDEKPPATWLIFMALWLTVYHGLLMLGLLDDNRDRNGEGYEGVAFLADVVDVASFAIAFAALGLMHEPGATLTPSHAIAIYGAASVPSLTSLWTRKSWTRLRTAVAAAAAAGGALGAIWSGWNLAGVPHGWFAVGFGVLLAVYAGALYEKP